LFLIQLFMMMFPLCHATFAWQDTFLQAAAIHHLPRSVSLISCGALQLDAGPFAACLALFQFPLQHDASLQIHVH
jgi:hypothetical protein